MRQLGTCIALVLLFLNAAAGQGVAAPDDVQDKGWPRQFETSDYFVRIHQPQVDDWPKFERLRFRAAVVVAPKNGGKASYGTMVASAKSEVAFEQRLVVLIDREIEKLDFPGKDPLDNDQLSKIVVQALPPARPQTISLDRVLAEVDLSKCDVRKVDLNLAPPKIFFSQTPAVNVIFLGKPRFKPVPDSDLMYAINTNWDVFLDPTESKYYLLNGQSWWVTSDLEKGPWTPTMQLPAALAKLPADENWADVRASVPGKPATERTTFFVSQEPAELIVTAGEPEMEPIPGTRLMLVSNTDSDLVYNTADKQFYFLTAGRWFKAPELSGPWESASAALPDDFKNIPENSDAGHLLVSVPGTPAANEAILMASIPNRATVNKADVTVNVTYQGTPDFRPIETTTVQYAYNSPYDVFLVQGSYYCCYNAVWFVAPAANGPWNVCTLVPAPIYTIPPTCPKYNVTYVHVYGSSATTVTCGYTSGYTGAQVSATGVVMFGMGMVVGAAIANNDDCWSFHYSRCFYSYGCGARWYPASGGFISTRRYYGPYGGAGGWAAFNPVTGRYSRGAYVYGPNGAAGYRAAFNPSTGFAGYRAGGVNPYGAWTRGAVTNGDEWIRGGRADSVRGGSVAGIQGSEGISVVRAEGRFGNGVTVARNEDGDIYAGRDGNVYRRTADGWQDGRTLDRADRNSDQAAYLRQQSVARQRGESNISRNNNSNVSGPSGGGRRGGPRR